MLTDHNAINANVPHFRGAMPHGFQLVVNLFSFIGAFNGCAANVNQDISTSFCEIPDSDVEDIIKCVKMGVKEVVGILIVRFGSVGSAPKIENVSLEEMVEKI